jgi:hypothetical protein
MAVTGTILLFHSHNLLMCGIVAFKMSSVRCGFKDIIEIEWCKEYYVFMNWSQKKVLVTGAGGFIGSHLVERLVELGAKVRTLVRNSSPKRLAR